MAESLNLKPTGGIRNISLYMVGEVEALTLEEGCPCGISLCEGASPFQLPLVEQRSHLAELITFKDGPTLCSHTLEAVMHYERAQRWLTKDFIRLLTEQGCIALVEFFNSESRLVGWSPKFAKEQPLRLKQLSIERGSSRSDLPLIKATLSSLDTDPAISFLNVT